MKVAVTSENGRTICGHNGQSPGFIIYQLNSDQSVKFNYVHLTEAEALINLKGPLSSLPEHPLHGIDALVTQRLEEWLIRRLKSENIEILQTEEKDALNAINLLRLSFKA